MNSLLKNLRDLACFAHGDVSIADEAADLIEELQEEVERLVKNAKSDTMWLKAYHKWCEMNGCAPSSSDLSVARAALGEKKDGTAQ